MNNIEYDDMILNSPSFAIAKRIKYNQDLKNYIWDKTSFLNNNAEISQRYHHIKNDIKKSIICIFCNHNNSKWISRSGKYLEHCDNHKCRILGSENSTIATLVKKDKELLNFIKNKTSFLNEDTVLLQRLYHIKNNILENIKCPYCNTKDLYWYKLEYIKTCGSNECRSLIRQKPVSKITKQKMIDIAKSRTDEYYEKRTAKSKKNSLEKYGVESYTQTDEYKQKMIEKYGYVSPFELAKTHEKSKETLIERYGVDHNFKIEGMQDKITETFKENYGTDRPSQNEIIKQKGMDTCNELYGGNSPMNNIEIQKKSRATLFKNYGIEYVLQSTDLYDRIENIEKYKIPFKSIITNTSFKFKTYIINDIKYNFQGYEDYTFFEILLKKYSLDDIVLNNFDITYHTSKISYFIDDKEHVYFPDFYIKSENKIIEVKSEYTFKYDYEINMMKKEACEKMGLLFEFMIIDHKVYNKWLKLKQNRNITI
jgi:hypothetical protein